MRFDSVTKVLSAAADVCKATGVARIVVLTFDSKVLDTFDVRGNFDVLKRVGSLRCGGGTIIEPVFKFVDQIDGPAGVRKLFVVTDGIFDCQGMERFTNIKPMFLIDEEYGTEPDKYLSRYGEVLAYKSN
ncbi:MAG: hypothetical protein EOP83_21200 [Verrucomicrobiaceae bacterium]|nr:MAG: hypothetical protein EOP83_21200 [Verrucomicrobiaceae bacterium]